MPLLHLPLGAGPLTRTIADDVGVTDSPVVTARSVTGTDDVGVTETVTTQLTATEITRSIADDVGVTDSPVTIGVARFGTDDVGITETVSTQLVTSGIITRSIVDNVGVTDTDSPEEITIIAEVTARAAVGVSARSATQLRSEPDLATWVAKWEDIPIPGVNTGIGGWRAGDGGWSVTHTNGASALFSYGDTPVTRETTVVQLGTSATSQSTQSAWVTVLDGQAPNFPDGSRIQVFLVGGVTPRFAANVTRRITGRNSFAGFTNLLLDYSLPGATATNDVIKGVTGGEEWYMFPPHSSAVVYTNGQMRFASPYNDSWIPRDTINDWYWAGPMIMEGDDLYVFPTKQDNSGAPWVDVGRGLFRFDWSDHASAPTGVTKIAVWGLDPCWGAAVVFQGGYYYIYGTYRQRTGTPWFDNEVYVARTTSMATAPTAWEFWTSTAGGTWATGAGYLTSRTGLQVLIAHDDVNGPENTFSAHYTNGKFTIASKRGGVYGSDIALYEATSVTGTYTRRVVGSAPNGTPTVDDQTYLTNAHYNLPPLANGKILISVSRNRANQPLSSFFDTDPTWYRPLWLEIDPADIRAAATRVAVGAVGRSTAIHKGGALARGVVGTVGRVTSTRLAPAAARGTIGTAAVPAARKVTAKTAAGTVGAAAVTTTRHLGIAVTRTAAGVAAAGVAAKRVTATARPTVGVSGWFFFTGGRLVASNVAVGVRAAVAGVTHRVTAATRAAEGAYASVTAQKRAPGVSGSVAGSVASTAARKAAPAVIRGTAGAAGRNSGVGHVLTASPRAVLGVSAAGTAVKRVTAGGRSVLGLSGRHSGALERAVSVTSALGFRAVSATLKAVQAVLTAAAGVVGRASIGHTATPTVSGTLGTAARGAVAHRGSALTASGLAFTARGLSTKRAPGTVRSVLATTSTGAVGRRVPAAAGSPFGLSGWSLLGPQPVTGGELAAGDRDEPGVITTDRAVPDAKTGARSVPTLTGGPR